MRMKDWASTMALVGIVVGYLVAYTRAQERVDAKAAAVMADVTKALGGDQKIAAMRGLSLRAEYRREMSSGPMPGGGGGMVVMVMGGAGGGRGTADGGAQATGKIEIDLDLPERFLRADIGSSGLSLTRTEGFEGSRPFLEVVGNSPGMRVQADNPASDPARAKTALQRNHVELARLMLGLFGRTQPGFGVSYAYAGEAESPDGKAHVIDVSGPDNFKARLFVDVETKLPLMLTYKEPEPRVVMRTMTPRDEAGGRGSAAAPGAELTPEQRAEYRLFFSDHRKVDGISLPHRIARGTAEKTTEEWDVKSYKINPAFAADRFKIGS